jgi:RNA polymerase sigma factor (sigma-70 family)
MLKRPIDTMLNLLGSMAFRQDLAASTDAQLLDRCIASRDDMAFEEMVRRHGPMVFAVCRRLGLGRQDAEDAFQATFLVLARKLAAIRPRGMVGNWLYGVAYRAALKAKTVAARRWAREKPMSKLPEPATVEKGLWDDLIPVLDQELSRLADKYRMPIVLCDLEGKTRKEAAQQLGWPEGTVAGRLAQARALLAKRLLKQGLPVSAGVLSALFSQNVSAAGVPATLVSTTLKAAGSYCARRAAAAGTVSANAAALADLLLKGMLINKLKAVGLMIAVLFAMVCGGTMLIGGQTGDSDAATKPPPALLAAPPGVTPKETPNDTRECQFPYGRHIFQVAFSPDGKLVVTDDQIWDAATGKKIRTLPLPSLKDRRSGTPFRLAFSPDSRHVAIHRYDDMVLVDVATGKEVWKVGLSPRQPIHSRPPGLSFTPDGKHIVTARNDEGVVRVFEASSGKEIRNFAYDSNVRPLSGAVIESFGVSADSKRLVVHRYEAPDIAGMVLFDLETGKELARHRLSEDRDDPVRGSAPSPDGRHVFYVKKGSIRMMELKTGKEIRRFASDGERAYSVSCSPDGKYVVAGVVEKSRKDDARDQYVCWIQCWEIATGKTVRVIKGNKDTVDAPTVSPDGRPILATVNDTTARLWRLDKWALEIAPEKPLQAPARPREGPETDENKREEMDLERLQGAWDSHQPDGKGVALLVHGNRIFAMRYEDDERIEPQFLLQDPLRPAGADQFALETRGKRRYIVLKNGGRLEYQLEERGLRILERQPGKNIWESASICGDYTQAARKQSAKADDLERLQGIWDFYQPKLGAGMFLLFHGQSFFIMRYDDDENLEFHQLQAGARTFTTETHEGKKYLVLKNNGMRMEYRLEATLRIEDVRANRGFWGGPRMAGDYRRGREATAPAQAEGKRVPFATLKFIRELVGKVNDPAVLVFKDEKTYQEAFTRGAPVEELEPVDFTKKQVVAICWGWRSGHYAMELVSVTGDKKEITITVKTIFLGNSDPVATRPAVGVIIPKSDTVRVVVTGHREGRRDKYLDEAGIKKLTKWIDQLTSKSFAERQRATKEIQTIGVPGLPTLEKAVQSSQDLEQSRRLEAIISNLRSAPVRTGQWDFCDVKEKGLEIVVK